MMISRLIIFGLSLTAASVPAGAALVVNPAQTITERVTVSIVQVAADNGSDAAPLFGSAQGQAAIFAGIDTIWAQAGIDIDFKFRLGVWNSSFALLGTPGSNNPRPNSDLSTVFNNASATGVLDPSPTVINLLMVRIVPGFSQQSDNNSNGLAFLNSNGIALWVAPNLTSFTDGQEAIAAVLAHEIGHNLGLNHIGENENLMATDDAGERLNAAQIATARGSQFSVAIPEPASALLALAGVSLLGLGRRRVRGMTNGTR